MVRFDIINNEDYDLLMNEEYIAKNITLEELLAKIKKILEALKDNNENKKTK